MVPHPSSSNEQRAAGIALVNALSDHLGITLESKVLELGGNCTIQIDGYSDEPPVICEAWAHIGKPKGSQPDKVMTDALKLLFCEKRLCKKFKKILLFSDEVAQHYFSGKSWQAESLREYDIEIITLQLPVARLNKIKKAQERQYR
jgi:hypothetical protein